MATTDATADLLARYADALCAHHPMPGGVLVVTDPHRTRFEFAFGAADPTTGQRPTSEQLFQVGSISKSFTALALLKLAAAGRLQLDDAVARWLPWVDLGEWTEAVTLRHLLSHTGGLVMGGEGLADASALAWTLRQRASSPPGERFHYSNHGYLLLGLVVAAVSGKPLAEALHELVFTPLAIERDALAEVRQADRPRFAPGWWPAHSDHPWVPGDPLASAPWIEMDGADGCVSLNAHGLARYLRLLLGDGTVDGRRVVDASDLRLLGEPAAPTGEDVLAPAGYPTVSSSRYGLGLNHELVDGRHCLTHGGGNVGYASFLLADVDAGLGIGVLTNANGDCLAAQHLARVAHLTLTAESPPTWDALPPVDLRVRPDELADGLLGSFSGDRLRLRIEPGQGQASDQASVVVHAGGQQGRLWRTLAGRYLTDHPLLRTFHLDPHEQGWSYGPLSLRPDAATLRSDDTADPDAQAYVGHYRSWTPWFPSFRIIWRAGRLLLTAPGGVEAPMTEEPLVPLGGEVWRVGADAWLPERLTELARVGGQVVLLDRDGARYSRAFTP